MSVKDAVAFFGAGKASTPAAHEILKRMADVGLGYLRLGQPLTTLSGGERQRLKLATHMGEDGGVYVLDEVTTGLHLADLEQLLGLLDRLVDSGKSVIVIEHHLSVMAHADWIIDLGPGAGHDGGRIVFEGTPADLVAARSTLTGEHLAAFVAAGFARRGHNELRLARFEGCPSLDWRRVARLAGIVARRAGRNAGHRSSLSAAASRSGRRGQLSLADPHSCGPVSGDPSRQCSQRPSDRRRPPSVRDPGSGVKRPTAPTLRRPSPPCRSPPASAAAIAT